MSYKSVILCPKMAITCNGTKIRNKTIWRVCLIPMIILFILPFVDNPAFEELRNPYYRMSIGIITIMLALHSVPHITEYLYAKERKHEDLIDTTQDDPGKRARFIKIHHYLTLFSLSVFICVLTYYYEFQYSNSKMLSIETAFSMINLAGAFKNIVESINKYTLYVVVGYKDRTIRQNSDTKIDATKGDNMPEVSDSRVILNIIDPTRKDLVQLTETTK